jgi:CheY-like chemotaxis protein
VQKENLGIAKSCAGNLLGVINDILDFSKMEAGKLVMESVDFDIVELVQEITKAHHIRAREKNIELGCEFSTDLPRYVNGDPGRLKQILNNLIGNAIKFTHGGKVSAAVKCESQSEGCMKLLFSISDTGIGISREEQRLLFKSFSQVDSSYTRKFGGTGLGLAISKQLTEMMGGTIWVESEKGKGSTFYFIIKLKTGLKPRASEDKTRIGPQMYKPRRILLAEDDHLNQTILRRILEKAGHSVAVAGNGREAVEAWEHGSFDIILMDIQMPEMDGVEAASRIRRMEAAAGSHIPIAALTAYALKGDEEKFLSLGMDGYVSKPIDINKLYETIEDLSLEEDEMPGEILSILRKGSAPVNEKGGIGSEKAAGTLEEVSGMISSLKRALMEADLISAEINAHSIKDASSVINAGTMRSLAFRIELAVRRGSLNEAGEIIKLLEDEHKNLSGLLK